MNRLPRIVEESETAELVTPYGVFDTTVFRMETQPGCFSLIVCAYIMPFNSPCLLRINSACFTSEVLGDRQCDCSWQLQEALHKVAEAGSGLVVYLPDHEGRGIGLFHKLQTMALMQRQRLTTAEGFRCAGFLPDQRDYHSIIPILNRFEISSLSVMTNNPDKLAVLDEAGYEVEACVPLVDERPHLRDYLVSKGRELGHRLPETWLNGDGSHERLPETWLNGDGSHERT